MDGRHDDFTLSSEYWNNISDIYENGSSPSIVDGERGRWNFITPSHISTSLTTDSIDDLLLQKAKIEMTTVAGRVLRKFEANHVDATRAAVTSLFIDPIVPLIADAAGSTHTEVVEFIRCLTAMSIYGTSPGVFFDRENAWILPLSQDRSCAIFKKVLGGLSKITTVVFITSGLC